MHLNRPAMWPCQLLAARQSAMVDYSNLLPFAEF